MCVGFPIGPIGRRRVELLLVLALGAFIASAPSSTAQTEVTLGTALEESVTVLFDGWRAYRAALSSGTSLTFSVTVTFGGPIDVYVLDDANYVLYKDPFAPSFEYFVQGSRENTTSFQGYVRPSIFDTFWVVVDNAAVTSTGALPRGNVSVDVSFARSVDSVPGFTGFAILFGVVVGAVVATVVIAVYLTAPWRRRPPFPAAPPPSGIGPGGPHEPAHPPPPPPEPPPPETPPRR